MNEKCRLCNSGKTTMYYRLLYPESLAFFRGILCEKAKREQDWKRT